MKNSIQEYTDDNSYRIFYKDITVIWLDSTKNIEHYPVEKLQDFFVYKNRKYIIDGHNVKYEFRKGEKEFAEWLSNIQIKK